MLLLLRQQRRRPLYASSSAAREMYLSGSFFVSEQVHAHVPYYSYGVTYTLELNFSEVGISPGQQTKEYQRLHSRQSVNAESGRHRE